MFPKNLGTQLSIDETALSNGELYTIVTNKAAKGRRGSLVAIAKGTDSRTVSAVLQKLSVARRVAVTEVTLDMSPSMEWIVSQCFSNARKVTDRFHAQQLVSEAVQDVRIALRWKAIDAESAAIAKAREAGVTYQAPTYANGDSEKQLLARSRYLLYTPSSRWSESQQERSKILFQAFPTIQKAYELSMLFRSCYEATTKAEGARRLTSWYASVDRHREDLPTFLVAMKSIRAHEGTILNYFAERSTNAAAESFNAKIKGFRALVRGVTDTTFFLYRLAMIYG